MQPGQVSSLVTQKVKIMTEAKDLDKLYSKRKAITSLLPYATWQELAGQPEMLNTLLDAARASKVLQFSWYHIIQFATILLSKATPHAIVLVSPYIPWDWLTDRGDLVQQWAAATFTVPYTEEVAQSVVDTLLQIASESELLPHIPVDVWWWLTKRPSLPPVCLGRYYGTKLQVIKAVQRLEDIEALTSYLLITWSEWDTFDGIGAIYVSIHEIFSRVGMGHHRADLIKQLDHVLRQLGKGLGYLKQHNPAIYRNKLLTMERQYGGIKEALLEANIKAITRVSDPIIILLCILTQVGNSQDLMQCLCAHFLSHVHSFMVGMLGSCGQHHSSSVPPLHNHPPNSLHPLICSHHLLVVL